MPIQIIDGFKLGTSIPIDDRIVASGSQARNNIMYKYDGLLVVDTKDRIPYIWNADSSTWSSFIIPQNNSTGAYESIKEITNNNNKYVYVGTPNPSFTTGDEKINIIGGLKSDFFHGDGNGITNINPSNILPGSNGQVLQISSGKPAWSTISVGTNISSTSATSTKNYYIGFVENKSGNISNIYNQDGVGLDKGVFYLNGIGLSSSTSTINRAVITDLNVTRAATFSRVGITDLNVSGAATFSRVSMIDLNVSRAATFSRVFTTDLNATTGTFSRVSITDLNVSRAATFSRVFTIDISATTGTFSKISGFGTIPIGGIIMWNGTTVPTGWALCNGTTVNGTITPNLSDRFIVASTTIGAGGTISPLSGLTFTIVANNLPKHQHAFGTLQPKANGYTEIKMNSDAAYNSLGGNNGKDLNVGGNPDWTNQVLGGQSWPLTMSGSTADNITTNTAITLPIYKYYKLAFIMRVY
jgi:hypothetical protein